MIDEKTFRSNLITLFDNAQIKHITHNPDLTIDEIMIKLAGKVKQFREEILKHANAVFDLQERLKIKKESYAKEYKEEMEKLRAENKDWEEKFQFVRALNGGQI